MNTLDNLIMTLGVFGSATFVIFILAKYNYLIKKAMVEKGMHPDTRKARFTFLDWGCIILSLGVGLGISSIFTTLHLSEDTTDLLVYSTLCVSGGLGLMIAHSLRKRKDAA